MDLPAGGNNNESGSGAFSGNSLINTTFLDNTSIDSDDDKDLFDGGNNNGIGAGAFLWKFFDRYYLR